MIRTEVTISVTDAGADTLRRRLADELTRGNDDAPKAFHDAKALWDAREVIATGDGCVVLRFEELAAGWAELSAIKRALVGLADDMHPYQAKFDDEYGTQVESYGDQEDDVTLPGERLAFDILSDDVAKPTGHADVALIEVEGNHGIQRKDLMTLAVTLADDEFEPISIDAKEHESCAMGLISTKFARELRFDYDELSEFVTSILDDMDHESESATYEFHGHVISLRR